MPKHTKKYETAFDGARVRVKIKGKDGAEAECALGIQQAKGLVNDLQRSIGIAERARNPAAGFERVRRDAE